VRVAIVGTDLCALDRRGGGLERVVLRWAAHLAATEDVVLVSFAPGGRPLDPGPGDPDAVTVERPADLGPALRALAPDVVSLHNRPHWWRHCPERARVAVTFHNFAPAWKVPASAWPALVAGAGQLNLSAVSGALAGEVAARLVVPRGRVAVTPPSIDPAFLDPPVSARNQVVLSPNRLLRKKGVRDLLAVAGRPAFARAEFVFVDLISPWLTPTAEHRALRAAVGAVPNAALVQPAASPAELARWYAACGVVACAVREPEGLGLVALEAQACRAPLVTTDMGGLREATFPPNRCIPPKSPLALADALADALAAPISREDARRRVLERHSPVESGQRFLRWVAEAVP
jgi:glycosyltransferase involved in cell wall biosynthesis